MTLKADSRISAAAIVLRSLIEERVASDDYRNLLGLSNGS